MLRSTVSLPPVVMPSPFRPMAATPRPLQVLPREVPRRDVGLAVVGPVFQRRAEAQAAGRVSAPRRSSAPAVKPGDLVNTAGDRVALPPRPGFSLVHLVVLGGLLWLAR